MPVLIKNNVFGFLALSISAGDLSVQLTAGTEVDFPTPAAGEYFYATLVAVTGDLEVIRVTARSGVALTVVRAQEGTTALSFTAGSRVELRVTAQSVVDAIEDRVEPLLDGTTAPTANLPMGTFRHTNVGVAVALTDYLRADQAQNSTFQYLTSVVGTNTITASASVAPAAYVAGQAFRFVSAGANSGATTLNVNSLGAKSVTKNGASALAAGDIPAGAVAEVVYDGTRFQLTNVAVVSGGGSIPADNSVTTVKLADGAVTTVKLADGAVTMVKLAAGFTLPIANGGTGAASFATAGLAQLGVAQTFTATQVADNGTASVSTTSTYTFDGADQIRAITLTGAITVTFGAPTGITPNAFYVFRLAAGDTSARAFAWNAAYKFPAATAPLTSGTVTNGASDIITFIGGAANTLLYVGHQADVR